MQLVVVIREAGSLKPDYSLAFDLPAIPRQGDYISIQRPGLPWPYAEDMIVRQVWWRLNHPETEARALLDAAEEPVVGNTDEIIVECEPAIGPWSSDKWRDSLMRHHREGKVQEFEIARLSVRQDASKK